MLRRENTTKPAKTNYKKKQRNIHRQALKILLYTNREEAQIKETKMWKLPSVAIEKNADNKIDRTEPDNVNSIVTERLRFVNFYSERLQGKKAFDRALAMMSLQNKRNFIN